MILYRMQNGWPTDVIQDPFTGTPPAGTMAFDGTDAMLAYQAANPDKAPKPKPESNVPVEVEAWRFRAVCDKENLTASIEAFIASQPEPPRIALQNFWEFGTVVPRNNTMVEAIGAALKKTDAQIDALFIAASKIQIA